MTSSRSRVPVRWIVVAIGTVLAIAPSASQGTFPGARASAQAGQVVEIAVAASRYRYQPPRIEVSQDDVVKVVFSCEDIAHSFTVDAYRISKRASPGQPVTFEFRVDTPGQFRIYCALAIDEGCRQMHGELVVRPR